MKKLVFLFCFSVSLMFANAKAPTGNSSDSISNLNYANEGITLINDSPDKLKIHTGTGEVTLNARGGRTSIGCNIGKSVKAEGKVIFKITEEMCGTTIKLSQYL